MTCFFSTTSWKFVDVSFDDNYFTNCRTNYYHSTDWNYKSLVRNTEHFVFVVDQTHYLNDTVCHFYDVIFFVDMKNDLDYFHT